jgi:hypothetical protein
MYQVGPSKNRRLGDCNLHKSFTLAARQNPEIRCVQKENDSKNSKEEKDIKSQ